MLTSFNLPQNSDRDTYYRRRAKADFPQKAFEHPNVVHSNSALSSRGDAKDSNHSEVYEDHAVTAQLSPAPAQSNHMQQPSLLQVFEAELSRKPAEPCQQKNEIREALQKLAIADSEPLTQPSLGSTQIRDLQSNSSQRSDDTLFPLPPLAEKREQATVHEGVDAELRDDPIELGIRKAVGGFEQCIRGFADILRAKSLPPGTGSILAEPATTALQGLISDLASSAISGGQGPHAAVATRERGVNQTGSVQQNTGETHLNKRSVPCPSYKGTPSDLGDLADNDRKSESSLDMLQRGDLQSLKKKKTRFAPEPKEASTVAQASQPCFPGIDSGNAYWNTPVFEESENPKNLRRFRSTSALTGSSQYRSLKGLKEEPELVHETASRFPSIAQLERSEFQKAPSRYPLIDLEDDSEQGKSSLTTKLTEATLHTFDTLQPKVEPVEFARPKSLAADSARSNMAEKAESTNSHQGQGNSTSGARLTQPFNAFDEYPQSRDPRQEGVRRSATVADLRRKSAATLRRPYSEHFSGDGRHFWKTFTHGGGSTASRVARASPGSEAQRRPIAVPPYRPGRPATIAVDSTVRPSVAQAFDASTPRPFSGTKAKISSCVDQLLRLGFGSLGSSRLKMYAEATGGDLEDSIDMIDEDQKAQMRL